MAESPEIRKPADSGTSETLIDAGRELVPPGSRIFDSGVKEESPVAESDKVEGLVDDGAKRKDNVRAEIDTSAPFESVKEAASRFGGFGFWKPHQTKLPEAEEFHVLEKFDIASVEEQAAQLEKDLIVKEREALEVLKELETTKVTVEELKLKLQKEMAEVDGSTVNNSDDRREDPDLEEAEKENVQTANGVHQKPSGAMGWCPSSAPGLILMELKQAKVNLTRTTSDLADIRACVESYNKKVEKERISLEKTRERLISSSSKISSLEEQLNQTRKKLQVAKEANINGISESPTDVSREIQKLSSEAEQFKKMGEVAKSEVLKAASEIEETRSRIKTAEIRLIAAKKMKAAARAAEAAALAEIKAMSNSEISPGVLKGKPQGVTLSFEEYSSLTSKAREAEEISKERVIEAMLQVDEANVSKMEILKRVEDATEEVKTSRKALEEALSRVEAANKGKLSVEDALRKWRSEHGQRRRSVNNSSKFKNSNAAHHRKDSHFFDVNGLNLVSNEPAPVLRPTLSIGQILSRKLLLTEDLGKGAEVGKVCVRRKVSLGQMLDKKSEEAPASQRSVGESSQKQFPVKRKKFGFAKFSTILAKQSKKKKPSLNLR